jgi:hypothetical protein
VTVVLPFEKTGAFADEMSYCTPRSGPLPTTYRGRYIEDWKYVRLLRDASLAGANGRMYVGYSFNGRATDNVEGAAWALTGITPMARATAPSTVAMRRRKWDRK